MGASEVGVERRARRLLCNRTAIDRRPYEEKCSSSDDGVSRNWGTNVKYAGRLPFEALDEPVPRGSKVPSAFGARRGGDPRGKD